jgi:hypothetical protein
VSRDAFSNASRRRRLRFGQIALVCVIVAVLSGCSATIPTSTHDDQTSILKMAIMTDYQQGMLDPGEVSGHLTSDQHGQLRARILSEYPRWFAGTLLTNKLSFMLGWADQISTQPAVRTTTARMISYDVQSLNERGTTADAVGSYEIYHVTATAVDPAGHEAMDGGWATLVFQAELTDDGTGWKVSSYQDKPLKFLEDPSARAGEKYMPSALPSG